ncbi:hypothetical protein LCGC14_1097010 [marine sediment metagenome]|uniref:Phage capsid-like C-terminal domain-containing protein n=1 Tax=marine sediment metagenome TaxID=412755 RepID=A0A0F9MYG6_9ZZZZ
MKKTKKAKTSKILRVSKTEFENIIAGVTSEAVKNEVKRLGLKKIDQKFGQFPASYIGKSEEDFAKMEKKQRVAEFVKAVFRKDMGALKAMKALAEGAGATGGFQVPEEFAAEINRIAEDVGLIRRFARHLPMGSDTLNVPRLASSVSVTFPGENVAGVESEPVWENVQLLAKTAVGLTVTSNELLADANISIVDLLAELFGEALASTEDLQGLVGTGSPFTGILGDAGVSVVTMGTGDVNFIDVDADDLRDMITQVPATKLAGASFTMHREIWGTVQKLKDADGNYIASTATPILGPNNALGAGGVVSGLQPAGTIWGYPVWLSDQMPAIAASAVSTKFISFGNYNNVWFGDRETMTLSISDSATVGTENTFEQNQSAVRVTERIAIAVGLPAAFSVLRTAAS